MNDAQRAAYRGIVSGPRGGARGPFNALLRSPELADAAQKVGAYIRFKTSLPQPLNELAILVTARYWTAQFEWYAHAQLAEKAGLGKGLISSIEKNLRPAGMTKEETAIYDFAKELHEKKQVSDAAFDAVKNLFGEKGVIDLVGACGYYTLVSMILNVERHPLPGGLPDPLKR
ncbi:MAG TPA: carboxymuconolactone decarboxylase family protein [Burkholderiales bacterium]|nr:carboxymuconolactone decarboxylase family protein [Burkholderiales bacterium]